MLRKNKIKLQNESKSVIKIPTQPKRSSSSGISSQQLITLMPSSAPTSITSTSVSSSALMLSSLASSSSEAISIASGSTLPITSSTKTSSQMSLTQLSPEKLNAVRIVKEMQLYILNDFKDQKEIVEGWQKKFTLEGHVTDYLSKLLLQMSLATKILTQSEPITSQQAVKIVTLWKCARRPDVKDYFKKLSAKQRLKTNTQIFQQRAQDLDDKSIRNVMRAPVFDKEKKYDEEFKVPLTTGIKSKIELPKREQPSTLSDSQVEQNQWHSMFVQILAELDLIGLDNKRQVSTVFLLKLFNNLPLLGNETLTDEDQTYLNEIFAEIEFKGGILEKPLDNPAQPIRHLCKNSDGEWGTNSPEKIFNSKIAIIHNDKDLYSFPPPVIIQYAINLIREEILGVHIATAQLVISELQFKMLLTTAVLKKAPNTLSGNTSCQMMGFLAGTKDATNQMCVEGYKRDFNHEKKQKNVSGLTSAMSAKFYLSPKDALDSISDIEKFLIMAIFTTGRQCLTFPIFAMVIMGAITEKKIKALAEKASVKESEEKSQELAKESEEEIEELMEVEVDKTPVIIRTERLADEKNENSHTYWMYGIPETKNSNSEDWELTELKNFGKHATQIDFPKIEKQLVKNSPSNIPLSVYSAITFLGAHRPDLVVKKKLGTPLPGWENPSGPSTPFEKSLGFDSVIDCSDPTKVGIMNDGNHCVIMCAKVIVEEDDQTSNSSPAAPSVGRKAR